MIDKYSAKELSECTHIVRLTFNNDGYIGHIAFSIGGNCKGAEILECGVDYLDTCDFEDIQNLVENDCKLKLHTDDDEDWEPWFSIELSNPKYAWGEDVMQYDDIDVEDLKNLLVGVEITAYEPE